MDTPTPESAQSLDESAATAAFADFLTPAEVEKKEADAPEVETPAAEPPQAEAEAPEVEAEAPTEDKITIEVDGKTVELTKEQLAEAYKSGLRQADYTKKTMEAAEVRKSAEAEATKAREERAQYTANLQKLAVQLEGALEQQQSIDWDALIASNPVEALRQQHLLQKRQAALEQTRQQLGQVEAQTRAEEARKLAEYRAAQQQELLAKLPDWKDTQKATAEAAAIKTYLKEQGFDDAAINGITDHRAVLLARDAMLYRQMMSKAQAAAKKVAAAPQKVVRPGVTETGKPDGRTAAMQRLDKSGRVEDAAEAFKAFL